MTGEKEAFNGEDAEKRGGKTATKECKPRRAQENAEVRRIL
jgi:hypothetical protein